MTRVLKIKCCDGINNWKNPFKNSDRLFCLSSEIAACHEVKEDMFMVLIWYYDRPNVYDYNYYL